MSPAYKRFARAMSAALQLTRREGFMALLDLFRPEAGDYCLSGPASPLAVHPRHQRALSYVLNEWLSDADKGMDQLLEEAAGTAGLPPGEADPLWAYIRAWVQAMTEGDNLERAAARTWPLLPTDQRPPHAAYLRGLQRWVFRPPAPAPGPTLWVVGLCTDLFCDAWDFIGVFDSVEQAEQECLSERHFVAPAALNASFNHHREGSQWPGGYFPHAQVELDTRRQLFGDRPAADLPDEADIPPFLRRPTE